MKAVQSLTLGLAVFTPLASAWPKWLPDVDALVVRQNDESSAPATQTATARATATPTAEGTNTASNTASNTAQTTNGRNTLDLNTAKAPTGTESASATQSGNSNSTIGENDPAGSVVMITPAATAGAINLYKIGDYVTWAWNYTNLQASPTAIDVLLSCSSRTQTWTLTQNMSFVVPATYTWDSSVQKTDPSAPLGNDEYTLVIYDAESSVTATPQPGYLAPASTFKFGMYTPQPYTPLNEWNCPVCSAGSSLDSKAIGTAVAMSILTVASFTWFVAGLGMF
ncbi:hypothetical protein CCHL11_05539 [Colletotrichum chlorophyti]|uniref:DUF7137 domain-containing protein n=1 Tax=Colletotrichum chlorophyti TaxID=708187 RepID=A0A1Q8RBQ0_9PEZI|nr:hypothetical protein CCHL11_05539 [Colletotrichum chlorophyti]